jgi:hypothetical protein
MNDTKSWFIKNINKIDRSLANLTKMMREKTQISKIRNAKVEIITNTIFLYLIRRLQIKISCKRQRRSLNINKSSNPSKGYDNYKH